VRAALAIALLAAGCTRPAAAPPVFVAAAAADAGSLTMSAAEATLALELNCRSCHSLAYVRQQRLTVAQWTATLAKMRGWGALLEEAQVPPLASALAGSRGPTAMLPAPVIEEVPPFHVEADGLPGDPGRGKGLFDARCLVCHGADARGGLGVNLSDRPLLQQPSRFADFVKAGRARMPPQPDLSPGQVYDLLAHLRNQ